MFCPNCGQQNAGSARFCAKCGTTLGGAGLATGSVADMPAWQAQSSGNTSAVVVKSPRGRTAGIIAVIIAVAAVLIIFFATGVIDLSDGASPGVSMPEHSLELIPDYDRQETWLIYDGELMEEPIDGIATTRRGANDDGSVALIVSWYYDSEESTVYCIENGVPFLIEVGAIYDMWADIQASEDCSRVMILSEGTLYEYSLPDGARTEIDSGFAGISHMGYSPDGKSFLYSVYDDVENQNLELYYYSKGEVSEIGDDMEARLVNDDGGIYYFDRDREALYYLDKPDGEAVKLISGANIRTSFTNTKQTQLIVSASDMNDEGNDVYFIEDKDEVTRLSGVFQGLYPIASYASYDAQDGYFDDLKDKFYQDSAVGDVFFLDKGLLLDRIASETDSSMLRDDGKTLYYLSGERLYRKNVDSDDPAERIANNVYRFTVTSDGKTIYFVNDELELHYMQGENESIKIADDCYHMNISLRDETVFFSTDYSERDDTCTLYVCTNEDDVERIASDVYNPYGIGIDDIYKVRVADDEYDIYFADSGRDFVRLLEGIDITEYDDTSVYAGLGGSGEYI